MMIFSGRQQLLVIAGASLAAVVALVLSRRAAGGAKGRPIPIASTSAWENVAVGCHLPYPSPNVGLGPNMRGNGQPMPSWEGSPGSESGLLGGGFRRWVPEEET